MIFQKQLLYFIIIHSFIIVQFLHSFLYCLLNVIRAVNLTCKYFFMHKPDNGIPKEKCLLFLISFGYIHDPSVFLKLTLCLQSWRQSESKVMPKKYRGMHKHGGLMPPWWMKNPGIFLMNWSYRGPHLIRARLHQIIHLHNPTQYMRYNPSFIILSCAQCFPNRQPFLMGN